MRSYPNLEHLYTAFFVGGVEGVGSADERFS